MNWTPSTPLSPHSGLPAGSPPTKDSTRCTILVQRKFFRMNTCKSASKQRTLTPFGMNTYEKIGEGGYTPSIQESRPKMKPESTGPAKRRRGENWPPGAVGQRLTASAIRPTGYWEGYIRRLGPLWEFLHLSFCCHCAVFLRRSVLKRAFYETVLSWETCAMGQYWPSRGLRL
jgi:hypothetical protein